MTARQKYTAADERRLRDELVPFNARTRDEWDAITLERAAEVMLARSRKPGSFWLGMFVKVLRVAAASIRERRP